MPTNDVLTAASYAAWAALSLFALGAAAWTILQSGVLASSVGVVVLALTGLVALGLLSVVGLVAIARSGSPDREEIDLNHTR